MEISKNVLLNAVNKVIPGIDKDANFTGADCIFFNNGHLKTFNDQLGFSIPLMEFDFQIAVNAKELQNILKKCTKDMIDFSFIENQCLKITAGRIKAELNLVETNDLIKKYSFFSDPVWTSCSPEYFEALNDVVILKNTINYEGVYVSENEMYCTDNLRINRVQFENITDMTNVWLPTEAVSYLLKHNIVSWYKKDNFIVCKTDSGLEIIFRFYPADSYPIDKLQKIFTSLKDKGECYEFDDTITDALAQMAITTVKQFDDSVWTDSIEVCITGKIVTFKGETDSANMTSISELIAPVAKAYEGQSFIVSIGQFQKAIEKTKVFRLVDNTLCFETDTVEYLVRVS